MQILHQVELTVAYIRILKLRRPHQQIAVTVRNEAHIARLYAAGADEVRFEPKLPTLVH